MTENRARGIDKRAAFAAESLMTGRQRQMIRMYYSDRLTMREIAEILGVGVPTVSRTIKRGLLRARRFMGASAIGGHRHGK